MRQSIFSFFSFDFVETQRSSFSNFLEDGIIREFSKRNSIKDSMQGLELIFCAKNYKLLKPKINPQQALLMSKTYESQLYVPAFFIDKQNKNIKLQWLLLGNIPLMTKRGHFIINGSPRVIVHQMVRSPGIYLKEKTVGIKKPIKIYYADLIPFRGSWVRLDFDKYGDFWVRMKTVAKIPLLVLMQALGLDIKRIINSLEYPEHILKYARLSKENPLTLGCPVPIRANSTNHALKLIASLAYEKKESLAYKKKQSVSITKERGHKFLSRKFLSPRSYDLGEVGRMRLNEKLGVEVSLNQQILTSQDFLGATNLLLKFMMGLIPEDDIDDLKNRRVRTSGELLQNQLGTGLVRLEKVIRERMKKPNHTLTLRSLITTKALNGAFREFFGSSPLSQFMDQANPLAEITHKRRLSSLGPGGVTRETAGMEVRGIHPTHYGRICPIETPEGQNAGLVNSMTTYARVNSHGFIETPLFSVFQGQIQSKRGPAFFQTEQEKKVNVAPADLRVNYSNFLPKNLIPIRNEQEFQRVHKKEVEFIAISPTQMISVATALIPFLEHDDANRALMGSNMQRQSVALLKPERPLVTTGLEGRVIADSGQIIQANASGFVSYISGKKINVESALNKLNDSNHSEVSTKVKPVSGLAKRKAFDLSSKNFVDFSLCLRPKNYLNYLDRARLKILSANRTIALEIPSLSYTLPTLPTTTQFKPTFLRFFKRKPNFYFTLKKPKFNPLLRCRHKGLVSATEPFILRDTINSMCFYSLRDKQSQAKRLSEGLSKYYFTTYKLDLNTVQKKKFLYDGQEDGLKEDLFYKPSLAWMQAQQIPQKKTLAKVDRLKEQKIFKIWGAERKSLLETLTYHLQGYERSNQDTYLRQRPSVSEGDWVEKGDILADCASSVGGELALGKNILVAYMPWDGYNFEDAILISERLVVEEVYTSVHIERYEIEIRETKFGLEQITCRLPEIKPAQIAHLDENGIAKLGSFVEHGDILVGKVTPIKKRTLSPHEKLLYDLVGKTIPNTRDTSLRVPKGVHGRVVYTRIMESEFISSSTASSTINKNLHKKPLFFNKNDDKKSFEDSFKKPEKVRIFLAEKRNIQRGDKLAGRHGNKGIVSLILPRQDMPYLPDGTSIDMVLNPLGVPSRMNVGQIFECLLGLAGRYLEQQYKIAPFDEAYGPEASRALVYSKLYEASLQTRQPWLFNPEFPGKTKLFDGRTGLCFDQPVTVGQAYILKLIHLVDEKIHARSTGPYSLLTQQPLRGRSKQGGQRVGEMEVWALEGFGAAYTLQELLTIKSDDIRGRHQLMDAFLEKKPLSCLASESFKVLIRELQSLCLNISLYVVETRPRIKRRFRNVMEPED